MTRRPGERPPPGGHAEKRRREFERQRGLSERRELDLDETEGQQGTDALPRPKQEGESPDDEEA